MPTASRHKTARLVELAIEAAVDGQRVAWISRSHAAARAAFKLVEAAALKTSVVEKVWSGHGNQRIRFTAGGQIKFLAGSAIRGHSADVEVLDEVGPAATIFAATSYGSASL